MELELTTVAERRKYYSEYFRVEHLLEMIGLSDFQNREFGFILENEQFVRNISFRSPSDLVDFLAEKAVKGAYVGGVYNIPPTRENTIQRIKWRAREFVFDIDMDEYGPVRTCGCEGAQVCSICWSLMNDAMTFLTETMRDDFGIDSLYWAFSGRRGVHGWMPSTVLSKLTQEQRTGIIGYLSMIHDETRTQSVDDLPKYATTLRDRIFRLLAKSFYKHSNVKFLRDLGFTKREAETAIRRATFDLEDLDNIFNEVTPNKIRDKVIPEMIKYRYPRIDKKVTMDTRRVLRIPGSIHNKSQYLCHFIENPESFILDQAVTVQDVLEETVNVRKIAPFNAIQT